MQTQQATWPEGVVARYLTVGGATVDITELHTLPPNPEPYATSAACTGCPATKEAGHYRSVYGDYGGSWDEHEPEAAEQKAREWAQAHAETCRALPKPEVKR